MSKLIQLSLTDFRQILREQFLWVMFLVVPVIQFVLACWLVPELIDYFPILEDYQFLIVGAMTLQVVTGIGFVIAMMLLDEKDDGVLTAIRVLPLSPEAFLTYRLLSATTISLIFAFAMLYFTGLLALSFGQATAAAGLFALLSPAVTLFMSAFGDNKVEGLAMFKGINLVFLLPIISFFVPGSWSYAFGIIPDYWSFQFIEAMVREQSSPWLPFSVGVLFHFLLITVLFVQFKRRVFN